MNDLEAILATLERIAHGFQPDSEECRAIESAAKALLFVEQSQQNKEFLKYLQDFGRDLSDAQVEYIKSLGLHSEAEESDEN